MPSQRQKGTKLAGAYVPDETDAALAALAKKKGFDNKADFLRALYDAAIEEDSTQESTSLRSAPRTKSKPKTK